MNGLEPAAIAGKVIQSAAKAENGDAQDRKALLESAKQSGTLDPAARAYAKRLAVKEQIRLKIWQPLGMLFGLSREYFEGNFADELADRVSEIPEEELVTPRLSVAGPTVQGIAFTADEPDLRAMYLNLLAAASDRRTSRSAHPSFAEIIRQLTPEEAQVLGPVLSKPNLPLIEIHVNVDPQDQKRAGYQTIDTNVMDWRQNGQPVYQPERSLQVVNWQRLGLVRAVWDKHLTAENMYDWAEDNPRVIQLRKQFDTESLKRVDLQRGVLITTEFGQAFNSVVISPATAAKASNENPVA